MENKEIFIIFLTIALCTSACYGATVNSVFGSVYKLFDFLQKDNSNNANNTTKTIEEKTVDELGISRGQCVYNFLNYISYRDAEQCYLDDEYILHLLPSTTASDSPRKPPLMVKCLPDHPSIVGHNSFRDMKSVQDIVELLKPIGNNTKRYQPGSCVLVYFYTATCFSSHMLATYINNLPFVFKTLPVVAIDAYKFHSFNTEFGIVALPTLMLFHQGRPVAKYNVGIDLRSFVYRHTGIKPAKVPAGFMPYPVPLPRVWRTDNFLILSWLFIILCAGSYFSKSQLFKQIVEMIKRNWRESEAQLEH